MEKLIVNNYGSFDVTFEKSKGSTMWDVNGKKYIDFIAGIGVNCLGHNYKPLVKAISRQARRQIHISNYYFSDVGLDFAKGLLASLLNGMAIAKVERDLKSTGASVYQSIYGIGMTLGPIIAGLISDNISMNAAFIFSSVLMLLPIGAIFFKKEAEA